MKKTISRNDPFYEKEKKKYKNPIASREYIISCLKNAKTPISRDKLISVLGISDQKNIIALNKRINAMLKDLQIFTDKNNFLQIENNLNYIKGKVYKQNDSLGFLNVEGYDKDFIISTESIESYLTGDIALAYIVPKHGNRKEAKITKIISKRDSLFIGKVKIIKDVITIKPYDSTLPTFLVRKKRSEKFEDGQIIEAKIIARPSSKSLGKCAFMKNLGLEETSEIITYAILKKYNLQLPWDKKNLNKSEILKNVPKKHEKRIDLRDLPFVTIDSKTAKDFDDAIYCKKIENTENWQIYVAISDVSHYIPKKSFLDKESMKRSSSIYLPNKVVHMIPEFLSSDLCSLKPFEDRLVLVCQMTINKLGKTIDYIFYNSIINSKARLTYDQLNSAINHGIEKSDIFKKLPSLKNAYEVYKILDLYKKERGALEIDRDEFRIDLKEEGDIKNIIKESRGVAHKIIEELMIKANNAAADFLIKNKTPSIYRIHGKPDASKIEILKKVLSHFTPLANKINVDSSVKDYALLIDDLSQKPDWAINQVLILRTLKSAIYSSNNSKHFGLALDQYTHFTSPIRRYPDLIVHRIIKNLLNNKSSIYSKKDLDTISTLATIKERSIDSASREMVDWYKCVYLKKFNNKTENIYQGVISGFNSKCIFVRLNDIDFDGIIYISSLPGNNYKFIQSECRLLGGKYNFSIGDKIKVSIKKISTWEKEVQLEINELSSE